MLEILAITAPIYLIILIGAVTVRFGLFRKADMAVLGKLVFNLALPCLLFDALSRRNIHEVINIAYLLAYSTGTLLVIGLGLIWSRYVTGLRTTAGVYAAMGMSCPNSAFVGFPILLLTLPVIAPTAFALNLVIENILVIPLLLLLVETSTLAGANRRQIVVQLLRRLISNPLILALIVALIVSLLQLKLPAPVNRTITLLAQASSAVSLLMIGGSLVGLPLRGMGLSVLPITRLSRIFSVQKS
jgi:malonate transporter